MQLIQIDVLDVQARASLEDMLYCVENASINLSAIQKSKIETALQLLRNWDFRFNSDSAAASVFFAWEL